MMPFTIVYNLSYGQNWREKAGHCTLACNFTQSSVLKRTPVLKYSYMLMTQKYIMLFGWLLGCIARKRREVRAFPVRVLRSVVCVSLHVCVSASSCIGHTVAAVGGVAYWLAEFVAWTKLTHVRPGQYLDGWPSSGGYTISVCNQPTRSTQPCIPPWSLNRVPASVDSAGVKAGMSPLSGGR